MVKNNVLIIGLGLLGTSLAMALKSEAKYRVYGYTRRREVIEWAVDNEIIEADSLKDLLFLLREADIIVLALPIPATVEFLSKHAGDLKKSCVLTDVGSTKKSFMQAAEKYLIPEGVRFVGSHPMAGTEKSGPFNAFKTLYDNADVFICKSDIVDNGDAVDIISDLWKSISCRVVQISTDEHDKLVAKTSHVAHILASALTISVLDYGDKSDNFHGCASGFRDTSRTASSDPVMWREIVELNREAVLEALDKFEFEYGKFRAAIENCNFVAFEEEFARGRALRGEWLEYMKSKESKNG
jgi:prephenate dehydrogenase